jgi:Fe-S-cluster containining protein
VSKTTTEKIQYILDSDNPIEIKRITNKKYRVGFCGRCGSCCKLIEINTTASDSVLDWLTGYGIKCTVHPQMFVSPDTPKAQNHSITMSIPITCTHLQTEDSSPDRMISSQTYYCDRHDKLPGICAVYPKAPSKHPSCTYVFFDDQQLEAFNSKLKEWEKINGKTKKIING